MSTGRFACPAPDSQEQLSGILWFISVFLLLPECLSCLPWSIHSMGRTAAVYTAAVVSLAGLLRRHSRQWKILTKPSAFRAAAAAAAGLAVHYAFQVLLTGLYAAAAPDYANMNDLALLESMEESPILFAVCVVLLAPISEEYFFRRILFRSLLRRNAACAYLLSSMAFSAVHVSGYIGSSGPLVLILAFAQYLPAGLCLAWGYSCSGTLLVPIVMHAAINLISLLASI